MDKRYSTDAIGVELGIIINDQPAIAIVGMYCIRQMAVNNPRDKRGRRRKKETSTKRSPSPVNSTRPSVYRLDALLWLTTCFMKHNCSLIAGKRFASRTCVCRTRPFACFALRLPRHEPLLWHMSCSCCSSDHCEMFADISQQLAQNY